MDEGSEQMTVQEYAAKLVSEGTECTAEDDLNENGNIGDDDHQEACDLAIKMAHVIDRDRDEFIAWITPRLDTSSV